MNSTKEKESKSNSKKSSSKSQKYNSKKTKVNAPVEPKPTRSNSLRVNSTGAKNALTPNNNNNNNNNARTKDPPSTTKPVQPQPGTDSPKFERSNSFSLTRSLSKLITSITGSKENIAKATDEALPYKFTRSRSMILLRRTNRRSVIEPQLEQLSEETEKLPDQMETDIKNKTPEVVPEVEFEFKKPSVEPIVTPVFNPQENFQKRRSSSFIASFRKTLSGSNEKKKPLNPKWSASLQSLQAIDNMVSYENMKFIDYDKFHNYEKNLERQLSAAHLETAVDVPQTPTTPTTVPLPPVVVRRSKKGSPRSNIRFDREQTTQSAIFDSDFEHNLDKPKNVYRFSLDSRKLARLNDFSGGSMILDLKLDALNLEDGSVGRRKRPLSFYNGSATTLRKSRSTNDVVDAGAAIQENPKA